MNIPIHSNNRSLLETCSRMFLSLVFACLISFTPILQSDVAAQDNTNENLCEDEIISIAQMQWPSASILAHIHAQILREEFGCLVDVVPGDLSATSSSMVATGRPHIAPEMWLGRIAGIWNSAIETQRVRSAAPSFSGGSFEGWFVPQYLAEENPELLSAKDLDAFSQALTLRGEPRPRFISCPIDWACAVLNRNLLKAYGLEDSFEVVEPANRFELDQLIGTAISLKETMVFYYWQPNGILSQFDFSMLDMGRYDLDALACLGQRTCFAPKPSAFPPEQVVIAVAENIYLNIPRIVGYLQQASMPLGEMNALLALQNENGLSSEQVAEQFVRTRQDIWRAWVQ